MSRPAPGDVHFVPKGKLGIIVHKDGRYISNAWVVRADVIPDFSNVAWLVYKGRNWHIEHHIPHGTFALILSEPIENLGTYPSVRYLYHVLCGEVEYLVSTDRMVNLYHADSPSKP